jgi:hypothetical protein
MDTVISRTDEFHDLLYVNATLSNVECKIG